MSKVQVQEELRKQRGKSPIQMKVFFAEIKNMLKAEGGYFKSRDLVSLFAEQKRPLKIEDVDMLLDGICENGLVKLQGKNESNIAQDTFFRLHR